MSLEMRLGKRGNLLTPGPDSYAQLLLKSPVRPAWSRTQKGVCEFKDGCAHSRLMLCYCCIPAPRVRM